MNGLLFIFEGKQVEVINFNGKALFNPYDVAECLDIKNVRDNISNFNQNQVIKLTNKMVSDFNLTGIRKLHNTGENFLTESGVYKLIFKSRKPNAERFQDWVTDEVLPRIRQYGVYIPGNTPEQIVQNGMIGMEIMVPADKYNKLVGEHLEQQQQLLDLKSELYLDKLKHLIIRKDDYTTGEIYSYVLDKNKCSSMSKEEFINLLINLGFVGMDCRGYYTLINPEKLKSIEPLRLTYKGLVELCYAIDHPGEINYHIK